MPTVYVPLDRVLDSPFQTRSHYDLEAVAELADSIERDGQLQTPVARLIDTDNRTMHERSYKAARTVLDHDAWMVKSDLRVQLAYGHTRARAWKLIWERAAAPDQVGRGPAGVPPGTMPVELRPLTDDAMERLAWEENERRRDLDPVDRAAAIASRIERHGWTHEEAGEALGLDRSTVSNILRWYEAFSADETGAGESALEAMRDGRLSESKARALVRLFDAHREHATIVAGLVEEGFAFELRTVVEYAAEVESAASVRSRVETEMGQIEAEVEAERKRREPGMFDDAPEANALTIGGERFVDSATGEPVTEHGQMEVGRSYVPESRYAHLPDAPGLDSAEWILSELRARSGGAHSNSVPDVRAAIARLVGLQVESDILIARAEGAGDVPGSAVIGTLRSARKEVHDAIGEADARLRELEGNVDGYDDGGAGLRRAAEAQGLEPFGQDDDGDDGPIMVPYRYYDQVVLVESVDGFHHAGQNYEVCLSVVHVRDDGSVAQGHQFSVVDAAGAIVVHTWPTIEDAIERARQKLDEQLEAAGPGETAEEAGFDEDLEALADELAEPADVELDFWPPVRTPDVWDAIDGMTVAELDEAYHTYALPVFVRYAGYYQTSQLKPAKQELVRRVVRHNADLAAVHRLTDEHLAMFGEWFDRLFAEDSVYSTITQRSRRHRSIRTGAFRDWGKGWYENVRYAGELAGTYDAAAEIGLMTAGELAALKRETYRLAASFCYSLFLERRAADVSADTSPEAEPSGPIGKGGLTAPGGDASPPEGSAGGEDNGDEPNGGSAEGPPLTLVQLERLFSGDAELAATLDAAALDYAFMRAVERRLPVESRQMLSEWVEEAETREAARLDEPAEAEVPA